MKGGKREMWGVGKIERGQKGDVRHMNVVLCVRLWLERLDVGFLDEVLPVCVSSSALRQCQEGKRGSAVLPRRR